MTDEGSGTGYTDSTIRINTPEGEVRLAAFQIEPGDGNNPPVLALQSVLYTDGAPVSYNNPMAMMIHRAPNASVKRFVAQKQTFTLLEANENRHAYKVRTEMLTNSIYKLYIKDGPGCTPQDYSDVLVGTDVFETGLTVYTGLVTGYWSATTPSAVAQVTELH